MTSGNSMGRAFAECGALVRGRCGPQDGSESPSLRFGSLRPRPVGRGALPLPFLPLPLPLPFPLPFFKCSCWKAQVHIFAQSKLQYERQQKPRIGKERHPNHFLKADSAFCTGWLLVVNSSRLLLGPVTSLRDALVRAWHYECLCMLSCQIALGVDQLSKATKQMQR